MARTLEDKMRTAIKKHCLECAGGNKHEVEQCTISHCPLFPYRINTVVDKLEKRKGKKNEL